ncbi:serine hydrolase [Oryzobacter sp. R7]|uniref:serine hydrolase n=1 Tax=Oryzobacter faecalis TaxID=3388656 RepID=UPI00398CBCE1
MTEPARPPRPPRPPRSRAEARLVQRPSPAVIARRRLVVGGGAVLGLGALGYGVSELVGGDAATSAAPSPRATGSSATGSATPTASPAASPSPSPSTPTAAAVVEAPRLTARLEDYLDERRGTLGLQLVDLDRNQVFRFRAEPGLCYSTIKVLILTTVLRLGQEDGKQLSERQRGLAERMITRSDNAATETLLAQVGRPEVERVAGLVGMKETEIDTGWWGHWRTVPGDLDTMVSAVLSSDAVLDGARRATARFMMADVVDEQRWGVFAPEGDDVYVAGKNGWGPMPDGYHLNTTGWVVGEGREYVLGVLSTSPRGFRYGRETISSVARLCHDALGEELA